MSGQLRLVHRDDHPGAGWRAHGTTSKWIWVIAAAKLQRVLLLKQRWLHVASRTTRHDRPIWDVPGSPYGLDVQFYVLGIWLLATVGLHRVEWPWTDERPARRTVQRWFARLSPHADAWHQAIRAAAIELVAPRHLEEILPAGGIPPPRGRVCASHCVAPAGKLRGGAWLLNHTAHTLNITLRSLLVVARGRWPEPSPART